MSFRHQAKYTSILITGLILFLVTQAIFSVPTSDSSGYVTKDQVLIFVSFSMPPASLTQWLNQAEKIHTPLIIRG